MIFIGHDIIDLQLAKNESNIFRKGYLDKVLTQAEQDLIQKTENPWLCFWLFWSQKEAVYKLIRQKGEKRGYFPLKIEIQHSDSKLGKVCFKNQIYYTQTEVNEDKMETIALENPKDFKRIITLDDHIQLSKNEEIPFLEIHQKRQAVSKSHHGRFESCWTVH